MLFGVKETSFVNNIVTTLIMFIIGFIIVLGSFKADLSNWSLNFDQPSNSYSSNMSSNLTTSFHI